MKRVREEWYEGPRGWHEVISNGYKLHEGEMLEDGFLPGWALMKEELLVGVLLAQFTEDQVAGAFKIVCDEDVQIVQ